MGRLAWRLEALGQLLFYLAAAVLIVVLPLHLFEHLPGWNFFKVFRQPARGWVLWLVLIFAGIHGSWGFRMFLLDYLKGRRARLVADLVSLTLAALIIGVGGYGLAKVFMP